MTFASNFKLYIIIFRCFFFFFRITPITALTHNKGIQNFIALKKKIRPERQVQLVTMPIRKLVYNFYDQLQKQICSENHSKQNSRFKNLNQTYPRILIFPQRKDKKKYISRKSLSSKVSLCSSRNPFHGPLET